MLYYPSVVYQTFNIRAFMATTTLLTVINTAPLAGTILSECPCGT